MRLAGLALIAVLIGAGCGPTPPQAPLRQAARLDDATSGISTACGLRYQLLAFDQHRGSEIRTLEATAAAKARKLASVYRRNPNWIYQGETVRQIVGASISDLRSCQLPRAAAVLAPLGHHPG